MEGKALAKPVKVSVFIKALRWSFLICGIIHGRKNWEKYHKLQTSIRDEHEKIRPFLEERMRAQSIQQRTDELKKLAADLGIELPPGWSEEGF